MKSPIFESFYQDQARLGNTDQCIGLYPEFVIGPRGQPVVGLLLNAPGTKYITKLGGGPVRGGITAKNGWAYIVSGNGFYAVTPAYYITLLGNLNTQAGPVKIIESPTQLMVVDGVEGWVWDFAANTWSMVIPNSDTDDAGPAIAIYQDGFGLVTSINTNEIYQTNYNDLSTLATPTGAGGATANNAFVQGNARPVVSMLDIHQEAWLFKSDMVEVWINQGAPGFAFVQLQGVSIPYGCSAPYSVARLGDNACWLGSDGKGKGVVYLARGYTAVPITPPRLAAHFQSLGTISDAIAYTYQSGTHEFYVLTFPTANETWAYDLSTSRWHRRGSFLNGAYNREIANCHIFFNDQHVVGDYRNGNLYSLSDSAYTDADQPRRWLRSWSALPAEAPDAVPMSFDSLQIILQTGIDIPAGTNPQIDLRFSDDGGQTWNGPWQMPAGKTGETAWRCIQNRLGSTSLTRGLDRIWEISGNDPIPIKISGAEWMGGPA